MKTGTEKNEQPGSDVVNNIQDLLSGIVDKGDADKIALESGLKVGEDKEEPVVEEESEEEESEEEESEEEESEEEGSEEESEEEESEEEEGDDKKGKKGEKKKPVKAEVKQPEIKKNSLGLGLNDKKGTEKKIVISKPEEILPILKSEFGIDAKSFKDVPKFFESAKKWRADSQSLKKATEDRDQAVGLLENAPEDIIEAMKLYYNGQDYKSIFEKSILDFSKGSDKQDVKKLVNHYFPEQKFEDEDFDADEVPEALKIAIKSSKTQYESEKTSRDLRAKGEVEKADMRMKALTASIDSSAEDLKISFPDASEEAIEATKKMFVSGNIMALFFKPDGTLKKDAFKRALLAQDGEELIVDLMEAAKRRGESETNEDILTRGASKQRSKAKAKGQDGIRKQVKEQVEATVSSQSKKFTY